MGFKNVVKIILLILIYIFVQVTLPMVPDFFNTWFGDVVALLSYAIAVILVVIGVGKW